MLKSFRKWLFEPVIDCIYYLEMEIHHMSNQIEEWKAAVETLQASITDFVEDVKALLAKIQNAEDFTPELAAVQASIAALKDADKIVEEAVGTPPEQSDDSGLPGVPVVETSTEPSTEVSETFPINPEEIPEG